MSKRIVKQVFLVFLVMSMLIAPLRVLAADENVNLTGMPIVNEPITMTMMLPIDVARGIDPESNTVWQYLEELTGIHWEYIVVDKSSWSERLNLTWASNDLPDLIYAGVNMADLRAYTGRQIMDIAPYPGRIRAQCHGFNGRKQRGQTGDDHAGRQSRKLHLDKHGCQHRLGPVPAGYASDQSGMAGCTGS